ncbi:phosphoadenylyl-sulfate reductase [Chryseobacterium sp. FH1]|uniref:phosphoadenylyl-sulfate reductase n=1 Tax=Chryseobacterium sp. FH1 TaxID=1233951 RepID=UPI0004E42730|nr:phosphoadenylyl-sulfate reductase [Chryseobacterium sp. FH1]KFC19853.1 phosphoadenosine phosphosulfate reductase [Chryseobacterium sp. FH1]
MNEDLKSIFQSLIDNNIQDQSIDEVLNHITKIFPTETCFSTSFSMEDQVITDFVKNSDVKIFTLDTGRLFEDTYNTWNLTRSKYKVNIKAYYPNQEELEPFIQENGPDSFYRSVENRKACCNIRKVQPLKRALARNKIWITGLRAEHSPDRENLQQLEWDESNQIIKFHPLLFWSTQEVKNYIKEKQIPYNILHDKGFVSIGCAPCTRAIQPGEDFRAGRWWWEDASKKECGLHVHK